MDDVLVLQALAEPTRLAIVRQLAADGEICACDFTDHCDVSQPTVSHHLKVLREAGVVSAERRGTWIYYRLEPAAAAWVASLGKTLTAGVERTTPAARFARRQQAAPPGPAGPARRARRAS